jgi:hypothetical protein
VSAWRKIKQQKLWHTKSRGVSYLAQVLPLREDIVQRFVEPGIGFALGVVMMALFPILGMWLMGASVCLLILEQLIHDQQLNMMLDQYDGIIDSKVVSENAAIFSGETTSQKPPTIEQASGVSVVVAPELQQMIAQRRAAKNAVPAQSESL